MKVIRKVTRCHYEELEEKINNIGYYNIEQIIPANCGDCVYFVIIYIQNDNRENEDKYEIY